MIARAGKPVTRLVPFNQPPRTRRVLGAAAMVGRLPPVHRDPVHRDPFDRLLVAHAMAGRLPFYTAHPVLTRYSDLIVLLPTAAPSAAPR